MNKIKTITVALAIAGGLFSASAFAAEGYLNDSDGGIVRSGDKLCWHVASFNKDKDGIVECGEGVEPPAPPPAPVVQNIPVIRDEDISVSSDVLFRFGSSAISERGKEALSKIYSDVQIKDLVEVSIVGHTDIIGNSNYNQTLSEKRAKTVADYLIGLGLNQSIVRVSGVGSTQAKKTQECAVHRARNRNRYISCLAEDRKVEIKISERVFESS